jgi:hypothetical protein
VFKAKAFARAASRAKIGNAELCVAILQVMAGQADDLGGGVHKKRLGKHLYRSIVLARGGENWVYQYLFAKQDRANIAMAELTEIREVAKRYALLSKPELDELVRLGDWEEICHGGL